AYLIRAVRNRARNFIRAERSHTQIIDHAVASAIPGEAPGMGAREQSIDEKLDADELETIVWGVVGKLPEPTQLILTLRWKHGLTWNAIAHAMNMNAGAVQMQHNRACKLLRQRLPKHLR